MTGTGKYLGTWPGQGMRGQCEMEGQIQAGKNERVPL